MLAPTTRRAPEAGTRTAQLRRWYEAHAGRLAAAPLILPGGLGVSLLPTEQARLNRFKLWFLREGGLVDVRGRRVLEFGCGHARLALETRDFEGYVGVDFVAEMIAVGSRRIAEAGLADRAHLTLSHCLDYDGPKEGFDVVGSLGMFEFVEDPEAVLRKLVYHLRPGGTLFLDFHHSSPLYDPLRRAVHHRREADGGIPKRLFGRDEIRAHLEGLGLVDFTYRIKEYPLLGSAYARTGWEWILGLRNRIWARPGLDWLGTDALAVARKPAE